MKRVVFITPDDLPHGFAAAGFEQQLTGGAEALATLSSVVADADVGVVIVDERLLATIDASALDRIRQRWTGILLVLPAPAAAAEVGEDYLQQLIRRALGYHIRISE